PEVWQLAIKLLRRGGVVNFFGGCPEGTEVPVNAGLLHYSELTLKASFHHTPALIRQALDIISRGRVTARDFVNRVEPLANLLEVMQHLMSTTDTSRPPSSPRGADGSVFLYPTAFLASPEAMDRVW